jgi:hypothetical protein
MIGTMVVAGKSYPLAALTLMAGEIRFTTVPISGPIKAQRATRLTIFGSDGRGVMQTHRFNLPKVDRHHTVVLTFQATIGDLAGDDVVKEAVVTEFS